MIFMIGLASISMMAAGFIVLHFAITHRTAELKVAGWVLVIGALVNVFFVLYYDPAILFGSDDARAPFCEPGPHRRQAPIEMPPPPPEADMERGDGPADDKGVTP